MKGAVESLEEPVQVEQGWDGGKSSQMVRKYEEVKKNEFKC